MALTSGFFNSTSNDHRYYSADQFGELISSMITQGVFENIGDHLAVTPVSGESSIVNIGTGRAWFDGIWLKNSSLYQLSLDSYTPASGQSRIDAIVLFVDHTNRTAGFTKVNGTPSATPSRPAVSTGVNYNQWPLAYVTRTGSAITVNDIANVTGTTVCPFITATLPIKSLSSVLAAYDAMWSGWMAEKEADLAGIFVPKRKATTIASAVTIQPGANVTSLGTFTVPKGLCIVTMHVQFDDEKTSASVWREATISSSANSTGSYNYSVVCYGPQLSGSICRFYNDSVQRTLYVNAVNGMSTTSTNVSVSVDVIQLTSSMAGSF